MKALSTALDPRVLADAPDVGVVRLALGLTLYLDQPAVWAERAASKVFRSFCSRVPSGSLEWYTTSQLEEWNSVDGDRLEEIATALSTWLGHPRHLLQLRVVDDTDAPSCGFVYREIDPRRARRAPTLELILPPGSDPALLHELAVEVASTAPILCGTGGYLATWNPHEKSTAFWDIHGWCKRFVGIDVQDPDAMAWRVLEGLPGTNWLTLLGPGLADRLQLDWKALAAGTWDPGTDVRSLPHALLVRAGDAPTVGDLNAGEYPVAYAQAARRLGHVLVKDPPEYWGGFHENQDTAKWLRRFVEPEGWQ